MRRQRAGWFAPETLKRVKEPSGHSHSPPKEPFYAKRACSRAQARITLLAAACLILSGYPPMCNAAEAKEAPDFKEVYELVRAHLSGISEAELNQAAVEALISALGTKVSLLPDGAGVKVDKEGPLVSKSSLFDGDIAYLRLARVDGDMAQAVRGAYDKFGSTNQLKGVVVDLRYANGDDYEAAAGTADLFVKKEVPLLNWGNGMVKSKSKSDAIALPVAVLVNGQTRGAAEGLAAILRQTGSGLILGSKTAGQTLIGKEFSLKNGETLRIATVPIELGDGSVLSGQGVKPDIPVQVKPEEERAYYADAFKMLTKAELQAGANPATTQANETNRTARRTRFNEAELVRERRDGANLDAESVNGRDNEPEKPVVRDPVLARALDLLKGLAVVRHSRS